MFTLWGARQKFCDGLTRRNFLQIGAFGAGLTLADLLRLRAIADPAHPARTVNKSAIMIYLPGGPSHMDMYDLKPNAPAEYRGEFRPIDTNVPGVQICEHFPLQARMWDKLACIRSIVSVDEHSDSLVMTGHSQRENMTANHPSFGSMVSRLRGQTGNLPPFVSLRGMSRGTEPGVTQGPLIEHHAAFPKRVNAGYLQVVSREHIRLRVWERGAGETLSCGTGACAAVASGIARNLLDSPVRVQTRGGALTISWAGGDNAVWMKGPAQTVFEGEIET